MSSPTPRTISAQDLGALDGSAFAAIVGHYVDVNGYVADVLTVADNGTTRHVLRLAGSSRADIKLACLLPAAPSTANATLPTFQAHVNVIGNVMAPGDRTVSFAFASRTAPIVLSPCRISL